MTSAHRAALIALALVFILSGCGGSESGSSPDLLGVVTAAAPNCTDEGGAANTGVDVHQVSPEIGRFRVFRQSASRVPDAAGLFDLLADRDSGAVELGTARLAATIGSVRLYLAKTAKGWACGTAYPPGHATCTNDINGLVWGGLSCRKTIVWGLAANDVRAVSVAFEGERYRATLGKNAWAVVLPGEADPSLGGSDFSIRIRTLDYGRTEVVEQTPFP